MQKLLCSIRTDWLVAYALAHDHPLPGASLQMSMRDCHGHESGALLCILFAALSAHAGMRAGSNSSTDRKHSCDGLKTGLVGGTLAERHLFLSTYQTECESV